MEEASTQAAEGAPQERFRRVMALFEEAWALPPEAREPLLEARAAAEPALAREVRAMLAEAARGEGALAPGAGLGALQRLRQAEEGEDGRPLPLLRGHYNILRVIGEGGMGIVYEAEQAIPRRRVALKALRAGHGARHALRRFEQEAHILGRLHHPGIAQIHEAGAGDLGRGELSYFVMELVQGPPLTVWARGRSLRERAEILVQVCEAVQHAHERRVIHRDLKPANILVDPGGQPKVLDFGVARLSDEQGRAPADLTGAGQLLGTLAYMSPEQVGGDPDEVDARADVYALGVIAYELFAGRQPLQAAGRTLPQMLLAVRDEQPLRLRAVDPGLPSDLEAIVAMALQKDKLRRYQSAAELGADLRRWLAGEPIAARPESLFYVLRKLAQRHRGKMLAGALALLALVGVSIWALASARRADRNAQELAEALHTSNVERGRLLGLTENLSAAEALIWKEHLARPDVHTHWALWDLYAHQPCLRTLPGHGETVLAVAASPDGRLVASASHDRSVLVRDWAQGATRVEARGFEAVLAGVVFAQDGARACAACVDGSLRGWDCASGAESWRSRVELGGELWCLCAASGGELLAVSGASARIVLLRAAGGQPCGELAGCARGSRGLALDAQGARLAVGGADGSLRVFDARTQREIATLVESGPSLAALSFDGGERLASADADGVLTVWDLGTRARIASLRGTGPRVRTLELAGDGERLLATTQAGLELWALASGTQVLPEGLRREPAYCACFAPDPAHLLSGTADGSLREWETAAPGFHRRLDWRVPAGTLLAFTRIGPRVAYMDERGEIVVREARSGEELGRLPSPGAWIETLAFDPAAERLIGVALDGTLRAWNWRSGAVEFALALGHRASSMRPSPDGSTIVCALDDGQIQVRDSASGALLRTLEPGAGQVERVTLSLDGARIASTHHGNLIRLSETRSGRLLFELSARRPVFSVVFARGGRELVVGAWDGSIDVWDLDARARVRTLEGHSQRVNALTLSPDQTLFASASSDGTLRLWDTRVAHCLATFEAAGGSVRNLVFSADGKRLYSFHDDGTLEEWDLGYYERHIAGNEAAQRAR